MARRCAICEKDTATGNQVSHSNRRTKRTWKPNVQKMRIMLDGRPQRVYVCTRCIKADKVRRAF